MKIRNSGTCYCVLLSLIWNTAAENQNNDLDTSHVRMWTGWYNTDSPMSGGGDDESVASIRKKGYEICDGNSPIDTICRDVKVHLNMFNSETTALTKDKLFIPCNTQGLTCRNEDQRANITCRDYEIRFECLSSNELPAPENLGVIGVAAGLSVIVPILCVAIMHVARLIREHRNPARQRLVGNSEQSVQTDLAELPPSYSFLFGEDTGTETGSSSLNSVRISLTGSSGDLRLPSTRLSSNNLLNATENQNFITSSPAEETDLSSQNALTARDNQPTTSWRSRFPNMHLSVFDLFYSSGQSPDPPSPQSPDLSYVQTPPPTYKDAIIILGGEPVVLSENEDKMEKL